MMAPRSISQIALRGKWQRAALTAALLAAAAAVWTLTVSRLGESLWWLSWVTAVALAIVAVTPVTKEEWTAAHTAAAAVAGACVTALTAVCCPLAVAAWTAYVAYTLATDGDYKVLTAELCCVAEFAAIIATS